MSSLGILAVPMEFRVSPLDVSVEHFSLGGFVLAVGTGNIFELEMHGLEVDGEVTLHPRGVGAARRVALERPLLLVD